MSQEELLAARVCQLERRLEDVVRAKAKLCVAREKNKYRFDRTHRWQPRKIEEGNRVLVYDNSLENQHKALRKVARRWFGPYVVTSVNNNATYHIMELDGTRIKIPVLGSGSRHSKSGTRTS